MAKQVISMDFKYTEDKLFFKNILQDTTIFEQFFDFRDPLIKRSEFNLKRDEIFKILTNKYGLGCALNYPGICDTKSGLTVDHIIPLKTNELNKKIRNLKAKDGKKVPSESYGSNNLVNLAIVCSNCNGHKKHRLPSREELQKLLSKR